MYVIFVSMICFWILHLYFKLIFKLKHNIHIILEKQIAIYLTINKYSIIFFIKTKAIVNSGSQNNKNLRCAILIAAVHGQYFPGAYAYNTPEQLEFWEDTASDTDDGGLSDHFPSEGS